MKKYGIVLVMILCLCLTVSVGAAEVTVYEQNFDNFTEDDLYLDGWIIKDSSTNVAIEDGALKLDWNQQGRMIRYWENISDYTVTFDWQPGRLANENECAYKSTFGIRFPEEYDDSHSGLVIYEPDNGDADKTSYLGIVGIYFYGYGTTFEVAIHVEDAQRSSGAGSLTYRFTLPEGKSFDSFQTVVIKDEGETVTFSVAGVTLGTVALSETASAEVGNFSGEVYRKAVVTNSAGETVLTAEHALVPVTGSFAFFSRGNSFCIDNLKVTEERETPPATDVPVPTGSGTAATESPVTSMPPTPSAARPSATAAVRPTATPAAAKADSGSQALMIAGIVAACIIAAGATAAILIKKRRMKK